MRGALDERATAAFAALTHLGDTATLATLAVVVALALWFARQRTLAVGWALALAGQGLLTLLLKAVFSRVRPLHAGEPLASGWSFPSGHTLGATVAWGMLAYVALRLLPPRWHLPAVIAAAALTWLVGVSRVVVGVHHPSDVLAGFALGGAWLVAAVVVLEGVRWRTGRRTAPPPAR